MNFALDEDDTFLEAPPPAAAPPLIAQTRSLGAKQGAVRWLPTNNQGALALAGSWDDPGSNALTAWSVQLDAGETDTLMSDANYGEPPPSILGATPVGSAAHGGCVLGLSVGTLRLGHFHKAYLRTYCPSDARIPVLA